MNWLEGDRTKMGGRSVGKDLTVSVCEIRGDVVNGSVE
jgi:hypothetical protein